MKILIDIGHPAHVHYFKNFIKIMESRGHSYLITTRDKDVTLKLLDSYGFHYICTGKNLNGVLGKAWSIIRNDFKILKTSLKFKPDLFLSFNLPYPAHVGFLLRKPVIGISDTEHASINHAITNPFTDVVLTPSCFQKDFGKKHIRFNGYMELCYLHPNYFTPDPSVLDLLNVTKGEKYVIIRFVSWNAVHDFVQSGISLDMKRKSVIELSKHARVFISSEEELPEDLKKYQILIPPEKMHDVLFYATLYLGESITMSTESTLLGTPSIVVSSLPEMGVPRDIEKYGMTWWYKKWSDNIYEIIKKIFNTPQSKFDNIKCKIFDDKIDVTKFLVDTIEKEYNDG